MTLTAPTEPRFRRGPAATPPRRRHALVVVALAVAGLALLGTSHLLSARRQLLAAATDLKASRGALTKRDDRAATVVLDRAARHLAGASAAARAFPLPLLRVVPLFGSPVRASATAARAGKDGVAAARSLVAASASFPTSASAGVDGHDLSAFHDAAARSQAAIADADARLAKADAALAGPAGAALPPVSGPARSMRAELATSRKELGAAGRGMSLLEDLTSSTTDARLLLLSQDSLELRATGGYIGSYGVLHFAHGTVKLEKYEATEDMPPPDPPARAPEGLGLYLPGPWRLSNVNWWPNFPTTAAAATDMFKRQGGGDVDGVLALTEFATARLVGALGPLQLPDYARPVVEDGFDARVVAEVEQKFPPDQPRKKFLIELANTLFGRLFSLPAAKLPAVTDAVRRSLGPGDIQLWFKDPARQRLVSGAAIAGALPKTDGDFLMVVDANMAASKANLNVTKQVTYRVDKDKNGRLVGHLRVEITNGGAKTSINPLYNSYLRVYAPAGSTLVNPDGHQASNPALDGPYQVFVQPLVVQPKETGVATFDYLLPDHVGAGGAYRLTWLRQPGTPDDRLRVEVKGASAQSDPAVKTLHFERNLDGKGLVKWLKQRWIVKELGL